MHNRRSIRLSNYDYSRSGLYFITICVNNREHRLGKITSFKVALSDIGKIADEFWLQIPQHNPNTILHQHIIMPNHIHGIIEISNSKKAKSSSPVRASYMTPQSNTPQTQSPSSPVRASYMTPQRNIPREFSKPIPGSLSVIIQQYKAAVKRWSNKNRDNSFEWQRNYYEHIIRNDEAYWNITNYIKNNPANWKEDKFY